MWCCWTRSRRAARPPVQAGFTLEPAPGTCAGGRASGRDATAVKLLVVADTGDQTITLKSNFGGETICMTAIQILGGTKYIKGEACRGNGGVTPLQQWNLIDASTPVPPPTPGPQATYDCPWSPKRQGKDKPCAADRNCGWVGPGAGMCPKCHNSIPGARAICGPK